MNHSQKAVSDSGKCPACGGTGWRLVKEQAEGYDIPLDFARPCTKCQGERRLEDRTGIPPQFHEATLERFGFDSYGQNMERLKTLVHNYFARYAELAKTGKGLYLWSKTAGSGKTFLACCLARSITIRYNLQIRFTTVPDYLALVADSYKRQQGAQDESEVFRRCPLLVLDDIGTQRSGEWQQQELFRIVNDRLNAGNITFFTSNMPPEKLNVDYRTIDRIRKAAVVLQMPEESIRLKKAQEEQACFVERMLM